MIRRALVGLVVAAVVSGCQVRTDVDVVLAEDGSGTVSVTVRLDADAGERVPRLGEELRLDDLRAAGWTVTGPDVGDDGSTTVRATKPFRTPAEAETVLREVAGALVRDVAVRRDRGFATTRYRLDATVDLGGGLEAFGDERLAALLDGEPLGEDVAAIEERIGVPLDEAFSFRFSVRLPGGDVEAREVPLGAGPVAMAASTSQVRVASVVLAAVAVLAAAAGVAVLAVPVGRRRR